MKRVLQRTNGQIVALSVVHPVAMGPVDAEGRAELAEQNRSLHPRSKAGALVILAGGFSGAIVRSISTGLNLLSPPGHPNKVFDAVEPAAEFLAPYVTTAAGKRATPPELLAAFHSLPKP